MHPPLPETAAAVYPSRILWEMGMVLLLIAFNALFSLAEYALITVRRTRIQHLAEEGNSSAALVQKMLQKPTLLMATIQLGVTLIAALSSGLAAASAVQPIAALIHAAAPHLPAQSLALLAVSIPVALLTLVLGEIAPKSLAVKHSERIALLAVYPLYWLQTLLTPLVLAITACTNLLLRPLGGAAEFSIPTVNEDELKIMVDASEGTGGIEPEEKEMIHSVLDFAGTVVRKVMTPRIDISACQVTEPPAKLVETVQRSGHSRIPVYEEDLDNIVGIVHAKDLLALVPQDNGKLQSIMRPAYFIPESKKVDELLTEFRHSRQQIALVRDEYGVVSGLVTIEDLLEEIVGEIQDEYDHEEPMIHHMEDGSILLDGRISLNDMNSLLETDLPETDADTLGGFVFALLGRQPLQNETVTWKQMQFTVANTDGRRIQTVRMEKLHPEPEHGEAEESE